MSEELTETPSSNSEDAFAKSLAQEIAATLTEPNVVLIRKIIDVIGQERTQAFLRETLEQEAQGGLLRQDGQRRTPGGAFFYHVRGKLPPVERRQLWSYTAKKPGKSKTATPTAPAVPPTPAMTWEEAKQVVTQALASIGEAKTVKLTLIGRPGKLVQQPSCVVVAMKGKEPPSLPKGLPAPPANSTITWAVFIANKQWEKVKDALTAQADDQLIAEGYPLIDPKSGANVVLVTSCKSVMQERAQRDAKK